MGKSGIIMKHRRNEGWRKSWKKYENSVETDTTCQDQSYGSYGAAAGMGPSAGGADISMAGGILDITV